MVLNLKLLLVVASTGAVVGFVHDNVRGSNIGALDHVGQRTGFAIKSAIIILLLFVDL